MNDFLDKLPDIFRRLSVIAMGMGYLFFVVMYTVLLAMPFFRPVMSWAAYAMLLVLGGLLLAGTRLMFTRLYRNKKDANQVTLLPTWFLQAVGSAMAIILAVAAYLNNSWWMWASAAGLLVAMLTIQRNIKTRQMHKD